MDHWKNQTKEWVQNKIYLLSTPVGAGIGIASLLTGMLIGRILLSVG